MKKRIMQSNNSKYFKQDIGQVIDNKNTTGMLFNSQRINVHQALNEDIKNLAVVATTFYLEK